MQEKIVKSRNLKKIEMEGPSMLQHYHPVYFSALDSGCSDVHMKVLICSGYAINFQWLGGNFSLCRVL